MKPNKSEAPKSAATSPESLAVFLFEKTNYFWLLLGIAVIVIGFLLMIGGGSEDPKVFNEAIFNFRRIRLAPTVVLIGFGITIFAILKNPKNS
jgi:hypothetical protein